MRTHSRIEHEYIYKVSWRATSVKIKVNARTQEEAEDRAINQVKKMLGGAGAMDLDLIEVRHAN
jgi:hypothetical protein